MFGLISYISGIFGTGGVHLLFRGGMCTWDITSFYTSQPTPRTYSLSKACRFSPESSHHGNTRDFRSQGACVLAASKSSPHFFSGSLGISWGDFAWHHENSPNALFVCQNSWNLSPYFHRTCQVWVGSFPSSTRPFHGPESSRKSREITGPGLLLWSGQTANSFFGGFSQELTHPSLR